MSNDKKFRFTKITADQVRKRGRQVVREVVSSLLGETPCFEEIRGHGYFVGIGGRELEFRFNCRDSRLIGLLSDSPKRTIVHLGRGVPSEENLKQALQIFIVGTRVKPRPQSPVHDLALGVGAMM